MTTAIIGLPTRLVPEVILYLPDDVAVGVKNEYTLFKIHASEIVLSQLIRLITRRNQCQAFCRDGTQCLNKPVKNIYCRHHG